MYQKFITKPFTSYKLLIYCSFCLLFIVFSFNSQAQNSKDVPQNSLQDSIQDNLALNNIPKKDSISPKRLRKVIWIGSALYVGTIAGLSVVWYGKGESQKFHFFDDNAEWQQMDKVGHFYTTFQLAQATSEAFRWAGMSRKKSAFWGMISGIALMTPIEILDGFSAEYGASWGDFVANSAGSAFAFGQYALWNEIRIYPKFSFHQTGFAPQRPELLGEGLHEEFLKDYNGQTYWLSFDMDKFLKKDSRFPKWLNLSLGYGAENMLFAQDIQNEAVGLKPFRKYFIGLDFDLTAIRTKNAFLKKLFSLINVIRLPAPALEYNKQKGFRFHGLYF